MITWRVHCFTYTIARQYIHTYKYVGQIRKREDWIISNCLSQYIVYIDTLKMRYLTKSFFPDKKRSKLKQNLSLVLRSIWKVPDTDWLRIESRYRIFKYSKCDRDLPPVINVQWTVFESMSTHINFRGNRTFEEYDIGLQFTRKQCLYNKVYIWTESSITLRIWYDFPWVRFSHDYSCMCCYQAGPGSCITSTTNGNSGYLSLGSILAMLDEIWCFSITYPDLYLIL